MDGGKGRELRFGEHFSYFQYNVVHAYVSKALTENGHPTLCVQNYSLCFGMLYDVLSADIMIYFVECFQLLRNFS